MSQDSNAVKDALRWQSAVKTTKLALEKWEALGFGINASSDPVVKDKAQRIYTALADGLAERNLGLGA